jgi:hypothetical protein
MSFDLKYFLIGVTLLWLPLPASLGRSAKGRYQTQVLLPSVGGLCRAWQNWVDLFRAAGGAYLLMNLSLRLDSNATPSEAMSVLYLQAGILAVGLLIQILSFTHELNVVATLFYLTGMTAVLLEYQLGGFAVLFGWALAIGTKEPRALLPSMALALALGGFLFEELCLLLYLNVALLLLPQGLALVLQKRILFTARERTLYREQVRAAPTLDQDKTPPAGDKTGHSTPKTVTPLKSAASGGR